MVAVVATDITEVNTRKNGQDLNAVSCTLHEPHYSGGDGNAVLDILGVMTFAPQRCAEETPRQFRGARPVTRAN